jgi:hypothetical protein
VMPEGKVTRFGRSPASLSGSRCAGQFLDPKPSARFVLQFRSMTR